MSDGIISFVLRFIIFCLATGSVWCAVSPEPHNTAGGVGGQILIPCGYTGPNIFQWTEFITNPQGNVIFTHPPDSQPQNSDKYEIEGQYFLRVKNLSLYDGGYYGCRDMSMPTVNKVRMVVLEPPTLVVSGPTDDGTLTATCTGRYGGPEINSNFVDMTIYYDGSTEGEVSHTPAKPGPQDVYEPGKLQVSVSITQPVSGRRRAVRCNLVTVDAHYELEAEEYVGELTSTTGSPDIYTTRVMNDDITTPKSDATSAGSVLEVTLYSRYLLVLYYLILRLL